MKTTEKLREEEKVTDKKTIIHSFNDIQKKLSDEEKGGKGGSQGVKEGDEGEGGGGGGGVNQCWRL